MITKKQKDLLLRLLPPGSTVSDTLSRERASEIIEFVKTKHNNPMLMQFAGIGYQPVVEYKVVTCSSCRKRFGGFIYVGANKQLPAYCPDCIPPECCF